MESMIDIEKFGVYAIINKVNNMLYIGSTSISFKKRLEHFSTEPLHQETDVEKSDEFMESPEVGNHEPS